MSDQPESAPHGRTETMPCPECRSTVPQGAARCSSCTAEIGSHTRCPNDHAHGRLVVREHTHYDALAVVGVAFLIATSLYVALTMGGAIEPISLMALPDELTDLGRAMARVTILQPEFGLVVGVLFLIAGKGRRRERRCLVCGFAAPYEPRV